MTVRSRGLIVILLSWLTKSTSDNNIWRLLAFKIAILNKSTKLLKIYNFSRKIRSHWNTFIDVLFPIETYNFYIYLDNETCYRTQRQIVKEKIYVQCGAWTWGLQHLSSLLYHLSLQGYRYWTSYHRLHCKHFVITFVRVRSSDSFLEDRVCYHVLF